ncbi:hypothetical protein [Sulfobacillus harzensis]|uniref:hypothetical protein n=1 Tax=Sulfobacillus harzensis TaxID=2729629 RepID=UPI001A9AEDA7|nr:hypothetical protein [Sulfobacillus harzensis]
MRQAASELETLGLLHGHHVIDGTVVGVPKAYPVYDEAYQHHVALIRDYLRNVASNLQLVGRNGMHRYNNQDHAMMTGFLPHGTSWGLITTSGQSMATRPIWRRVGRAHGAPSGGPKFRMKLSHGWSVRILGRVVRYAF